MSTSKFSLVADVQIAELMKLPLNRSLVAGETVHVDKVKALVLRPRSDTGLFPESNLSLVATNPVCTACQSGVIWSHGMWECSSCMISYSGDVEIKRLVNWSLDHIRRGGFRETEINLQASTIFVRAIIDLSSNPTLIHRAYLSAIGSLDDSTRRLVDPALAEIMHTLEKDVVPQAAVQ